MAYIKLYKGLDLSAGPQIAFLLKSVANGKEVFENVNPVDADSITAVAFDYIKDRAGQAGGAYADQPSLTSGKFFKPYNFDINLGLHFNVSQTVKFDLRSNYGLVNAINDYYKAGFGIKKINRMFGAQASLAIEFGKKEK